MSSHLVSGRLEAIPAYVSTITPPPGQSACRPSNWQSGRNPRDSCPAHLLFKCWRTYGVEKLFVAVPTFFNFRYFIAAPTRGTTPYPCITLGRLLHSITSGKPASSNLAGCESRDIGISCKQLASLLLFHLLCHMANLPAFKSLHGSVNPTGPNPDAS